MTEIKGNLFNIQPYSIHDGPGIRTTFFFKGCPLSCKWCQNPESQSFHKQLLVVRNRCTGCGQCVKVCPAGAVSIRKGIAATDRLRCTVCGQCILECPEQIREICGESYTITSLMKRALADQIFYEGSGGGITVSGGEPLFQSEFVRDFLKECKREGLHTAVDTTGFASWESARSVFQYADLVLFDLKHMDSEIHKILTGVGNEQILENLKRLSKEEVEIYIRIPVIPGMNDSDDNIQATADFVKRELGGRYRTFLLPYHRMGESKLESLEVEEGFLHIEPPTEAHMQHLKGFFDALGLDCQIGG